jgi:hypothetical protein
LYQIYEHTGNKRFLAVSLAGAKQLLLWTRSNPLVPDSIITVNKGGKVPGIFPGRRQSNIEGQNPFVSMDVVSYVPEEQVPAWQTSLNGLLPEAAGTYAFGPIMLAHHAPWLLLLAKESGDTLLRDAAYNAVIGRYANFPGYYFTSLETNVYQKADYPMRPFSDIKYNAIFYNHVWPHLALLMDFLVSDFYYRSNGKIDFPSVYAPGYAFLTSKVYGVETGSFMGNKGVQLWMPQNAVVSPLPALNHLFGVKDNDLYLALANTSPQSVKQIIRLNPSVIPCNANQLYKVDVYNSEDVAKASLTSINGNIEVEIPPHGLVAYKINGLNAKAALLQKPSRALEMSLPKNRFARKESQNSNLGTSTAMIIQTFPQFADFYIFSDRTEKEWQSASLRYKIGSDDWKLLEDNSYPYEFRVHLDNPLSPITYILEATEKNGQLIKSTEAVLNN